MGLLRRRSPGRVEVLVKACLNGPRTRDEHPAVPVSPAEISTDVRDVVSAQAGAVHFHPRGKDGRETLEASYCAETIGRVRKASPKVPVGVSTARWIEKDPVRKLALIGEWTALPDFASVNFNEPGAVEVCRLLVDRGIGVEAGIWSVADAKAFVKSGLGEHCLRVLIEITEKDPARAVGQALDIEDYLTRAGVGAPRLHHGYGRTAWAVMENALRHGKDVRIGLEDTMLLPDGRVAKNNRELVEIAVGLARRCGRSPVRRGRVEGRPPLDLEDPGSDASRTGGIR